MIFCREHNFLFIKNMKVGSTSIEVELSKILPDSAIITKINPPNKDHQPRNFENFRNHASWKEVSESIDLSNVMSYTIVRHPYEIVLSDFFFRPEIRKTPWHSISKIEKERLVDYYFNGQFMHGSFIKSKKHLYTVDEKIVVSDILRYELGLEDEINRILPKHGLKNIKINTFEKAYRPKNVTYNEIFSRAQLDMISEEWSWEFMNLGYNG
jgi:hypothetical protein